MTDVHTEAAAGRLVGVPRRGVRIVGARELTLLLIIIVIVGAMSAA